MAQNNNNIIHDKVQGVFRLATSIETLLLDIIETDNGEEVIGKYKDLAKKTYGLTEPSLSLVKCLSKTYYNLTNPEEFSIEFGKKAYRVTAVNNIKKWARIVLFNLMAEMKVLNEFERYAADIGRVIHIEGARYLSFRNQSRFDNADPISDYTKFHNASSLQAEHQMHIEKQLLEQEGMHFLNQVTKYFVFITGNKVQIKSLLGKEAYTATLVEMFDIFNR
jgi:hypothetical protein